MEALPFEGWKRTSRASAGGANEGRERLSNRSGLSRALLLAGGCCSSLFAVALPSAAQAQTTDQQDQTVQPPETTPTPGEPNAPQPATPPGTIPPPTDNGAIVVTGIR